MKLLKLGVKHDLVTLARQWLREQGFFAQPVGTNDVFDVGMDRFTKTYQEARHLDNDGKIGPLTWGALEADHVRYSLAKLPRPLCACDLPPWVRQFQAIIDAWGSGKIGYGTPQDKRRHMIKRPVAQRLRAERFHAEQAPKAKSRFGTTHTCGGCSSMASRTLAGILFDHEHRAFTNQTAVTPPKNIRDPRFRHIRDNVPDAMIDGDHTWEVDDWRPTCRGYSTLFEHKGPMQWSGLHEAMRDVPFAILHLQGGHVICAFWVDHAKGWSYTHPQTGQLLSDGCWIWAADGWSGATGQPTTLQRQEDRLSKKYIDNVWCLMRPDGYTKGDPMLLPCIQD